MKSKREIPGWGWFVIILLIFFVFFVALPFIGSVFRRVPLAFFFLWIGCPCLAWGLRSSSLDELLTSRGYSKARKILVGIAVAMSFSFFAHYDYLQDQLGNRYLDPVRISDMVDAVIYYEKTGEWPYGFGDASVNSFSGKVILYSSQWVMIGLCIGIPVLTWKIASASIQKYERRKRQSNCIDSGSV